MSKKDSDVRFPRAFDAISGLLLFFAVGIGCLAFNTHPMPSSDIMGKLASPSFEDRRDYDITRKSVGLDGIAFIEGQIPGEAVIRNIGWYVDGAKAKIVDQHFAKNRFAVTLHLPTARDRWTIFAIARSGGLAHYISMREPLELALTSSRASNAVNPRFPIADMPRALAAFNTVTGDGPAISIAGQSLLHVYSGARLIFVGWASDPLQTVAPKHVFISFDNVLFQAVLTVVSPNDAALVTPGTLRKSAFTATIPSTFITPGPHLVSILIENRVIKRLLLGYTLNLFVSTM